MGSQHPLPPDVAPELVSKESPASGMLMLTSPPKRGEGDRKLFVLSMSSRGEPDFARFCCLDGVSVTSKQQLCPP